LETNIGKRWAQNLSTNGMLQFSRVEALEVESKGLMCVLVQGRQVAEYNSV